MSIEKSNYLIGNRTRDLPACSVVPQPPTLPRAALKVKGRFICDVLGIKGLKLYIYIAKLKRN
jgi:hypothetical protein